MGFIFDEFIMLKSIDGDPIWVSAAAVQGVVPVKEDINQCYVHMLESSYFIVGEAPSVVKHKVDEARKHQSMKFDQVVRILGSLNKR